MSQPVKIKICLVGDMLSGGGAEKAHAALSRYLFSKDVDVHNIIVQDVVTYSYSGKLLNLGKHKNISNGFLNKYKRLTILRDYIKTNGFDYIIDFRMRKKPLQDLIIAKFVFKVPTVYTIHSSNLEWYLPKHPWLARLIYGSSYGIAALNHKMKCCIEQRHGLENVTVIYNPVDVQYINEKLRGENNAPKFKYVLSAGRFSEDNVKQFDKLIEAYAASVLPENGVKLVLLGEGIQKESLERLTSDMHMKDNVIFGGFKENPYAYMEHALFYALSSRFEGMPMVLLESLACGTPVVAFDCFTGPSEIIKNGYNGLLILNQDFAELTKGMNRMYLDDALYDACKKNAVASIEKFSMENVGKSWLDYLKIKG